MKLNIGDNIRTYRRKIGWTQEQLADRLGVSGQSVSRWENGATYPDMEFLPVMARLFGCTTDDLLGCGEDHKLPSDEELGEAMRKAMEKLDVPAITSILRTVRCECSDGAIMEIWPTFFTMRRGHPLYGNEEMMKELRALFREMLNSDRFHIARSVVIHTWLALENDEGAEDIIQHNAAGEDWDMSYIGLRTARAEGLADFDAVRKMRAVRRFIKLNEFLLDSTLRKYNVPRDSVNSGLWKGINERKLRVLHEFCGMTPDPMHPISGDGEPDIFVGTRLEIGFFYGAQLAAQGEPDAALTVFEDCWTLLEKVMEIPDDLLEKFRQGRGDYHLCPTVTVRVPELEHLTCYIRPGREFIVPREFPFRMELLICGGDGKILHSTVIWLDLQPFLKDCQCRPWGIDGAWLDIIRPHPRYQALLRRMESFWNRWGTAEE